MRCEYCTRKIGAREIVHGIRYGTVDNPTETFIPAKQSASNGLDASIPEVSMIFVLISVPGHLKFRFEDRYIKHQTSFASHTSLLYAGLFLSTAVMTPRP